MMNDDIVTDSESDTPEALTGEYKYTAFWEGKASNSKASSINQKAEPTVQS